VAVQKAHKELKVLKVLPEIQVHKERRVILELVELLVKKV
jgi:hypothetical protein|tara:strand:- start:442 stop:561 length:120 start_codon:yes stop_codon:yes gene_type:complete